MDPTHFLAATETELSACVDRADDVAVPVEYRREVVEALIGLQTHARRVAAALDAAASTEVARG